jgi:hypothetical protein
MEKIDDCSCSIPTLSQLKPRRGPRMESIIRYAIEQEDDTTRPEAAITLNILVPAS